PYRAVRMRSATPRGASDAPGRLAYEWRIGGAWEGLAATAVGAPTAPEPGSQEAFVTQHHWGYTRQRDGGTAEYEVVHPPWRVWTAAGATLTMDVARLYGPAFAPALARAPGSALVAEGSSVIVYAPRRLVTTDPRRMSPRRARSASTSPSTPSRCCSRSRAACTRRCASPTSACASPSAGSSASSGSRRWASSASAAPAVPSRGARSASG